jgi:2-C-methyl-D-erythritol 2,4-cyclodiphosphate synthase
MRSKDMDIRIGQGVDIHRFAEGRRCVLGGVEIPHSVGLLGHSDADVLIHALMDAILGASGQRDIGYLFPDTDSAFKDADSCVLLKRVWDLASKEGWTLNNADISLLAEAPRIKPYVTQMQTRIAEVLGCDSARITIKATTTEKLGFVGREEGIVAMAVVLLSRP